MALAPLAENACRAQPARLPRSTNTVIGEAEWRAGATAARMGARHPAPPRPAGGVRVEFAEPSQPGRNAVSVLAVAVLGRPGLPGLAALRAHTLHALRCD